VNAVAQRVVTPALAQLFTELADRRLFVVYKLIPRADGRTDKVPVDPLSGQPVDAHNVTSRMPPHEAQIWWQLGSGDGVGIVITEDSGLWFLDLDKCREGDGWAAYPVDFFRRFPGAYVECSASGQGLHALGSYSGPRPHHGTRNKEYRAELYTGSRFCALTGAGASGSILTDHTATLAEFAAQFFPAREAHDNTEWTDGPCSGSRPIADDATLIERAMHSRSAQTIWGGKASFADLWTGNADVLGRCFPSSRHDAFDRSAADQALANKLAFFTGNDCERMLRLMRQSALLRTKWERQDYVRGTILRACADQREWYTGGSQPSATVPPPHGTAVVPAPPTATSIDVARAADITPESVRWLWVGWLPSGKLVILAGAPGTGKSTIAFTLAAIVSRGGAWPDKAPPCAPANVLIWSGEDDAADTIVPRLIAAGADLTRVHIIRGKLGPNGERMAFDPSTDLPQLEQTMAAIINPVVSAVAGDMNKSNEVRRSLQALVDLGAKFDCAVIGITHFRKGSQGATPHERVLGSQAFGALARIVLIAAENEENGRRVFARAKSNISKDRGGIEYALVPQPVNGNIASIKIDWGAPVEGTAREILKEAEREPETVDEGECAQALSAALRDSNGAPIEVPKQIVEAQLKQAGYTEKQIRRARERLKLVTWLEGFGPACKGMWRLPDSAGPPR
jgi:putative DNA primase/helicase